MLFYHKLSFLLPVTKLCCFTFVTNCIINHLTKEAFNAKIITHFNNLIMKRNFTIVLLLISIIAAFIPTQAKQVNIDEAEAMAKQVYAKALQAQNISFKTSDVVISSFFTQKNGDTPLYNIFNFASKGFVILSAEDNYNALLAFSTEGTINFETKDSNPVYTGILKEHEVRIKYVKENQIKASSEIEKEWADLRLDLNQSAKKSLDFEVVVAPLTTTTWGQGTYYNQFLPVDTSATQDDRVYGGCVPLAMAQLIKHHEYPVKGNGSLTYTDDSYGELSADFCATTYNWDNMPNELTDYNEDLATLISHVGIATKTDYSPVYTSTYSSRIRNALVNYFGFDNAATYFFDAYNDFPWVARQELDAGRPLIITGNNSTGNWNHCWVVDGYGYLTNATVTQQEYFHMNWGWYGEYNGWYLDTGSHWAPLEGQDLDRDIIYIYDRYVVHNLYPAEAVCQAPNTAYVSTINDTYLYLYYNNRDLEEDIQFRYRLASDTDWTETAVTDKFYQYVNSLTPDTQYEFQVKRTCCGGIWSDYGPTETFRTAFEGESCEFISSSGAADFAEALGYDLETNDLYRVDYNQNGYEYIYAFRASCDRESVVYYYDCYGNNISIDNLGDVSYSTLNYNDCVVPVDCANHTGSFFFTECDNGENYYFIETEDGTIYDPYFPDSLDIDFVEGTIVNFDFVFTDFTTPCSIAAGGAIWFTCIEYNSNNPEITPEPDLEIFETYPFLEDLVDPANCSTEKIDVYDRGAYAFINIEFANGDIDFYLSTGTFYCSTRANFICTELYNLTDDDITASWACGDTTDPEPEPDPTCSSDVGDLYTSFRSSSSIYLYTPQPNGEIPNQFRFRQVGSTEWTLTDISGKYYKTAKDITAGVEYEFQMRNECLENTWSAYTNSYYFTISTAMANSKQTLPALSKFELHNTAVDRVMKIYPNPAVHNIQITGFSTIENDVTLTVSDLIGNVIINEQYNTQNPTINLNINNFPTGIYIAELQQGDQYLIKKFIKE